MVEVLSDAEKEKPQSGEERGLRWFLLFSGLYSFSVWLSMVEFQKRA
jgi:hypothetical protein